MLLRRSRVPRSAGRCLGVLGTDIGAVEAAVSAIVATLDPEDRLVVRLALPERVVRSGLRRAFRWHCADRLRDHLRSLGRQDPVTVSIGSAELELRDLVRGASDLDVVVLADSWAELLVLAVSLGPDVWLRPAAGQGPAEVVASGSPMELLRTAHGSVGRSLILRGSGRQERPWWSRIRQELLAAG